MLTLIVATDSTGGIGKDNTIPWTSRADLRHFREITTGSTVIMGFNTFKSLDYKVLPNRTNIVVLDDAKPVPLELMDTGCLILFESCLVKYLKSDVKAQKYLIGGARIYQKYIGYCDRLIHTTIMGNYECDTSVDLFNHVSTGKCWNYETQDVLDDGSVVRYYGTTE